MPTWPPVSPKSSASRSRWKPASPAAACSAACAAADGPVTTKTECCALPAPDWGGTMANLPSDNVVMIDPQRYPRLSRIEVPADLRQFPEEELPAIAEELRAYLIEQVAL